MKKFVDIHHHLIYGVDDGPRTMEDMQQMILRAVEQNVGDIICTSHATPGGTPFPADLYLSHMEKARQWIAEKALPIRLYDGCELLYTDATARLVDAGHFPSLANTYNVLVEFSPDAEFKRLCDAARSLGNVGLTVVFAHVERYEALRNLKNVRELREEYGVHMQMNANTIVTKKGFFFERWVRNMLEEGLIDCIGTDAHNVTTRRCSMMTCYQMLAGRFGTEYADHLCGGFACNLLGIEPLEAEVEQ